MCFEFGAFYKPLYPCIELNVAICAFHSSDADYFGYDMSWWKEEHFNASDVDTNGLLNLAEFNE
jgi:hypothetical protein